MLNLVEKFDFMKDVVDEIKKLMLDWFKVESKRNGIETPSTVIESYDYQPRLIGQERNGIMIIKWNCEECPFGKTFVALFDHNSRNAKLIFTQEKLIQIANASVNSDQTVLAFTVVEKPNTDGYVSPSDSGDVFKSYIAEVAPQNRVFSLNIEWKTYQKVQFLHEHPQANHKISHLLFFHHKESIGLYHVPVVLYDKGYVMNMQPSTQQIIGHFLWCHFDVVAQRLFFVKLYPIDEEEIDAKALLTVVEFKPNGDFEYVLNFPLPIPFKMAAMQQQSVYYDNYFSSIVSSKHFNMEVITVNPGSFYVCYQHATEEKAGENYSTEDDDSSVSSSREQSTSSLASDSNGYINYTVCCVHSGYKLQCSTVVSSQIHDIQPRVLFTPLNDYIAAYLPGCFLHLLDISCEHEPVHNILLRDDIHILPTIEGWERDKTPLFSHVMEESLPSLQHPLLFENETQKAYKLEIDIKAMFKIFLYSKASTRVAIFHSSMLHVKDKRLTRSIIERFSLDPANFETSDLIKEYLIATSYIYMKRSVATALDLKVFPFTFYETYRGQVERNEHGERLVHLFYKNFSTDLIRQLRKVLHNNASPFWSNVYQYLCYEVEHRNKRFPLKLLYLASLSTETFAAEVRKSMTSSETGAIKAESTNSLPELRVEQVEAKSNLHKNTVTMEKIVAYIVKIFGKETKSKAIKMCQEYASVRCKVVNTLWRIVLKSLNFESEDAIYSKSLNEPADEFELALFQITERFKVIFDELSHPSFPRLNDLLCFLGFRSLTRHQFQEYLDAHVFVIDCNFVSQVVVEIPDLPVNVAVKQKLIACLSKEDANFVLKYWGHPTASRYLAQHIMLKLPSEAMHYNLNISEEQSEISEAFVPLRTLLQAIKISGQRTSILQSRNVNAFSDVNLQFLANTVLDNTESLISPDTR